MDEQLEQQIEGRGAEAQSEEAVLSPAGEEAAKEAAERTNNQETEVKTESSAEEKVTPNAELSASEEEDNTSPTADAVPPPHRGGLWFADYQYSVLYGLHFGCCAQCGFNDTLIFIREPGADREA